MDGWTQTYTLVVLCFAATYFGTRAYGMVLGALAREFYQRHTHHPWRHRFLALLFGLFTAAVPPAIIIVWMITGGSVHGRRYW